MPHNPKPFVVFFVLLLLIPFACSRLRTAAVPSDFKQVLAPPLASDRFIVDLRYNTDDNFLHRNVYGPSGVNKCWVHPIMAERLSTLEKILTEQRLKLVIWDCWRPVQVQREMWKVMPDPRYVADPKKGSNHNRGLAMDCALADEEGRLLPMPTAFDDFTETASPNATCSEEEQQRCANRDLQIRVMQQAGFEVFPTEWWHYQPIGIELSSFPVF